MNYIILFSLAAIINKPLDISSAAFSENDYIPAKYSCEGDNINPSLKIQGIPDGTKSLAIIMDDPDAPMGTFVHWVMWNIPITGHIEQNSAPGVQGANGKKENKYTGPCPPSGIHHYHFKVYALNVKLDIPAGSDKDALEKAMEGHILGSGDLVGLYKKHSAEK